jgi:hypothetical protein
MALAFRNTPGLEPKPAVAGNGGSVTEQDMGTIRKAMALRVKYRLQHKVGTMYQEKVLLALRTLGVHPQNRGGVYPNGETVKGLGVKLLESGFSKEEANHLGVCVENVPKALQTEHFRDIGAWNKEKSAGVPELQTCFCDEGKTDILHGTLSHSHLLLMLLCWMTGARWDLKKDDGSPYMCTEEGCLDMSALAVAGCSDEMLETIKEGIGMEVLSFKIWIEEPDGASLISQALNSNQNLALKTTELTAMECLTSRITLMYETMKAEEITFAAVKEAVRKHLDVYVDEPEFVEMFEFAISLGAKTNSYISDFLVFAARYVDSKTRSLRLSAFVEINKLPEGVPRCKIAILKRAYRKKPVHGICPSPEALWSKKSHEKLIVMEELLHYFHVEIKSTVAAVLSKTTKCCSCQTWTSQLPTPSSPRRWARSAEIF